MIDFDRTAARVEALELLLVQLSHDLIENGQIERTFFADKMSDLATQMKQDESPQRKVSGIHLSDLIRKVAAVKTGI